MGTADWIQVYTSIALVAEVFVCPIPFTALYVTVHFKGGRICICIML